MPNESNSQRRARQVRDDRDQVVEAAQTLRHRVNQARYRGLVDPDALYAVATVLDSCAMAMSQLPNQVRRDVTAAAARLVDDSPATVVEPLTRRDGF